MPHRVAGGPQPLRRAHHPGAFGLGEGGHRFRAAALAVAVAGMGEHAGEARAQSRGDLRQGVVFRKEAAPALADIHLDQRRHRARVRGDGAGGVEVVGDDLHLGSGDVQLRHRVQLPGRDADGVDLVAPAALGEEARLRQGADGDRPVVGRGEAGHVAALGRLQMRAKRHARMAGDGRGHGGDVPPKHAEVEHQAGRGKVVERHATEG